MSTIAAPPVQDSVVELNETQPERRQPFYLSKAWVNWLILSLLPRVQTGVEVLVDDYERVNQSAALAPTDLPTGPLAAGTYLVAYTVRVTTPDGVASSVQPAFGYTELGGGALTLLGDNLTADSASAPASRVGRITIAGNSKISLSAGYSSNTPNKMKYTLQASLVRLGTA